MTFRAYGRAEEKGVFAPDDWDSKLAERSGTLPNAQLQLEFVYGYAGAHDAASNLHRHLSLLLF